MRIISRTPKGKMLAAWAALFVALVIMLGSGTVGYAEGIEKVHVEGDIDVVPVLGVITDSVGIDAASSSVTWADGEVPSINIDIDGLSYPGAYALVHLTIANEGDIRAVLTKIDVSAPDADFINLELPETLKVGESIKPGGLCELDILVQWDADSTYIPAGEVSTGFKVDLYYENNDYYWRDPKSGDESDATVFFVIAGISALVVIFCLLFIIRNKKKEKTGSAPVASAAEQSEQGADK